MAQLPGGNSGRRSEHLGSVRSEPGRPAVSVGRLAWTTAWLCSAEAVGALDSDHDCLSRQQLAALEEDHAQDYGFAVVLTGSCC
jgi:hypothetical protein